MQIGKLCFGSDVFQYGIELCLFKAGIEAKTVDKYTARACDILLVSMFWFRDIYLFERFRRESGLNQKESTQKPVVIIGGLQATLTPELCAQQADYVFIGDGDDYLSVIVKNIEAGKKPDCEYLYQKGDKKIPQPAECQPMAFAMQKGVFRNTTRIEIARGCRHKCKFCVLSQLKSYREVAADDIIDLVVGLAKSGHKLFSFFAPERTLHSEWNKIENAISKFGLIDVGFDVRLENLGKLKTAQGATFGLEGISYRLRKLIGKPFKEEFILEKIGEFIENRQRPVVRLNIYWIADLPGESKSDWDELRELFAKMGKAKWSRSLTLSAVLNPLSPKPFTPMRHAEIHPFRDYQKIWYDFLRNDGKGWGFRILESHVWHPWIRLLDSIVHRGGVQAYEAIRRMPNKLLDKYPSRENSVYMARKLLREIKNLGITEEMLFAPDSQISQRGAENATPTNGNNRAMRRSA